MKKTIWIFKSGELSRSDNTLLFENTEGKKYLPIEGINDIYIFGEISLNTKLLNFLSQKHIVTHFFNYYGYFSGSYYPREFMSSGEMIVRQVEAYLSASKRLNLARLIEEGASSNMISVLNYYKLRGKEVENSIDKIKDLKVKFIEQTSISSLMGIEGKIRDIYYSAFDNIIQDVNFKFEMRSRRPPLNNINAMISFGNSIMYTICLSEIYKTHLDPRIGFLHESNFRRFSLNLDIAEIFKPILIDRLLFTLINEKIVQGNDFIDEGGIVIMKEGCKKDIVTGLDKKLATTIKLGSLSHEVSYRRLIRMECYKIEKHILGEKEYKPFVTQW
jgi:CRISPR-associated protein Cas1